MERYATMSADAGHYVFDTLDERLLGEPHASAAEADMAAFQLNRQSAVRASIVKAVERERDRQDQTFGPGPFASGTHLAVLAKKLGDASSALLTRAPRERQLATELVEMVACGLRWLEHIEVSQ